MRWNRAARCLVWAVAIIGTAASAVPRAASASCGDYLDHPLLNHARTIITVSEGKTVTLSNASAATPEPCRGPHCRASQPTPMPVPVTDRVVCERLAVLLVVGAMDYPITTTAMPVHEKSAYTCPLADGIFHPPRHRPA